MVGSGMSILAASRGRWREPPDRSRRSAQVSVAADQAHQRAQDVVEAALYSAVEVG
jgi:hypothetical protein